LKKRFFKGKSTREKIEYARMLDTDKHPEVRRKIARLEKWRERNASSQKEKIASTRPKKAERDHTKALDFRGRLTKRDQATTADRSRRSSITDTLRRAKKEDGTAQRSPKWRTGEQIRSRPSLEREKPDQKRELREGWRTAREPENRQSNATKTDRVRRLRAPSVDDTRATARNGDGETRKSVRSERAEGIARSGELPKARAREAVMRRFEERAPTDRPASRADRNVGKLSEERRRPERQVRRADRNVRQLFEERVQLSRTAPRADRAVVPGQRDAPVRRGQPIVGNTGIRTAKPITAPPGVERSRPARRIESAIGRPQQMQEMRRQDAPAVRTQVQGRRGTPPADSLRAGARGETNARGRAAAFFGGRGKNRR